VGSARMLHTESSEGRDLGPLPEEEAPMNDLQMAAPLIGRARLRATVATIEREANRLLRLLTDEEGRVPKNLLQASCADLVAQMALGPEPEVRRCSVCEHLVMRDATLCGHCWTRLAPPPARPTTEHPSVRP